jgi:hypothetical protein
MEVSGQFHASVALPSGKELLFSIEWFAHTVQCDAKIYLRIYVYDAFTCFDQLMTIFRRQITTLKMVINWPKHVKASYIYSVTCYATEDTVRIGTSFYLQSHTRNYNHSQLFLTLCHIHTAYNLTRQYSILS